MIRGEKWICRRIKKLTAPKGFAMRFEEPPMYFSYPRDNDAYRHLISWQVDPLLMKKGKLLFFLL
jgi:hypothetical protein